MQTTIQTTKFKGRKLVFSPYFRNNVNPHFPYGCSQKHHTELHKKSIVLINTPKTIETIGQKRRKKAVIKAHNRALLRAGLSPKKDLNYCKLNLSPQ